MRVDVVPTTFYRFFAANLAIEHFQAIDKNFLVQVVNFLADWESTPPLLRGIGPMMLGFRMITNGKAFDWRLQGMSFINVYYSFPSL